MSITLFVGDCTKDLGTQAKDFDSSAFLVEFGNYKKFLTHSESNLVAYTSFADLPKITDQECVFFQVLNHADNIHYCPPEIWSDHSDEFRLQNTQQITEYFLHLIHSEKKNVQGLDLSKYKLNPYLKLRDTRKTNQRQLWLAGCSITAGVGVQTTQRYAQIIADEFDLCVSDLSRGGSSLEFATDQILRSDIRKDDVVLWGLTSEYRALIWDRKTSNSDTIHPYKFDYHNTNQADDIADETRLFKAVTCYFQVRNFCQKLDAILVTIPLICSEALQLLLHSDEHYYQLPYRPCYLDLGSDRVHPGPKQHQWYADQIKNILEKNGLCATTR
jgi:hypothetical protein